jgi:hypothetical protein
MSEYRRAYIPGGSWFFTVNLAERKNNRLLIEKIDLLSSAFEYTQQRHRGKNFRQPEIAPGKRIMAAPVLGASFTRSK